MQNLRSAASPKRLRRTSPTDVIALLLALAALAGCHRPLPPAALPPQGVISGGIGNGGGAWVLRKLGQAYIVVCCDDISGTGSGSGSSGSTSNYSGRFYLNSGPEVLFDCQTNSAGNIESLRIDGTTFNLAGGRLFLIATKNGKPEITQVDRDLSKFAFSGSEKFQLEFAAMADALPELERFRTATQVDATPEGR